MAETRSAPDDELPNLQSLGEAHDDDKGLEEVVLERVICQLISLQKLGCKLAQAVHRVHGHLQILVAAHLHKEV